MDPTSAARDEDFDRCDEAGQGMVEYAFIIALIAIVVVLAVQLLGHTTYNLYSNVSNGLPH
jgi:pilus assembly protein Flp/PilA